VKFKDYIIEKKKEDSVGVFLGRMSGLTIGHMAVINLMSQTHPHSFVVLVKGEKTGQDKNKNPFPLDVQRKMIEKVLPDNVEMIVAKTANLEDIVDQFDSKNITVYAGPDRVKDYRKYASYVIKKGYHVQVVDTDQMAPRKGEVSGTKLRESLKTNNLEMFKKIAPEEIWGMFDELREYIK
jgi:nicotinamide mononucleotide adenylyltransferase